MTREIGSEDFESTVFSDNAKEFLIYNAVLLFHDF